jgi:hypothetical protein
VAASDTTLVAAKEPSTRGETLNERKARIKEAIMNITPGVITIVGSYDSRQEESRDLLRSLVSNGFPCEEKTVTEGASVSF